MIDWILKMLGKEKQSGSNGVPSDAVSKSSEFSTFNDKKTGKVRGESLASHTETIRELERNGDTKEAISLLLECVEATEQQAEANGMGVAPWYYERLAIIYRKQKQIEKELDILERYDAQPKAKGAKPKKLAERLQKVREKVSGGSA